MVVLAVSSRMRLKVFTAVNTEVGGGRSLNLASERAVKDGQSARLKLVKVHRERMGGVSSMKETVMGRWSEFRATCTCHSTAVARCAEISDRSGEDGTGSGWVGAGPLSMVRALPSMAAATVSPRAAARSQLVLENQASLWAFRSPRTRVSASEEKRGDKVSSDRVWPGQLDAGGT